MNHTEQGPHLQARQYSVATSKSCLGAYVRKPPVLSLPNAEVLQSDPLWHSHYDPPLPRNFRIEGALSDERTDGISNYLRCLELWLLWELNYNRKSEHFTPLQVCTSSI